MYADSGTYRFTLAGLPDPELDPQFYRGVPARRFAAWLIDVAIILCVGVPVALLFGVLTLGIGFMIFPLILAAIGFAYRVGTISDRSATWGMRVMGIEFRRGDGQRFDFVTALGHVAIYTLSMAFVLVQLVSCLAMLGTRYGQGLPDIVLRTTAINRPVD
ncbi:RDD family protein [Amaricoccus solimangrovi]|uniref:RDD family protein n=1 Tax=Amaricoccus solimangrovi TaxID=2589815 RepID=A0A501X0B3_9RHOB|nr:RDD family protein [Amaricoccus solimangrovi]TPE53727.1 RDD family protein [Amaricoccus solimangrovi]